MPHDNTWEPHGVVKRFHGFVTAREFVDSAAEIAADPRFDDLHYVINDFLQIDGHDIDAAALEEIAVIRFGAMASNPNIRVLLLTADEKSIALARATLAPPLDGSYETRAFPSLEAARDWLSRQAPLEETASRFR